MCGSSSSGCGVFPLNPQKSKKPVDGHATGLIMRKAGLDALSVVDLAQKAERAGEAGEGGYDDALDGNNNGPAPKPRSSNSTGGLLGNKSANLRTSAVGEGNFHIKEVPWSRQGADAWPDKSNYWNRESGNRQGSTKTKISTLLELPFFSSTAHGFLLKCSELCISEEHFMQLCEKAAELDPVIADDLAPLMKSAAGPWLGRLLKSRGVNKGIGETMKTAAGTPGFDPSFMGPVRPALQLTRTPVPKMKTYTGFPGSGIPGGTLIGGGKSLLGGLRRGFGGARSAVKSLFGRGTKAVPKSVQPGFPAPLSGAGPSTLKPGLLVRARGVAGRTIKDTAIGGAGGAALGGGLDVMGSLGHGETLGEAIKTPLREGSAMKQLGVWGAGAGAGGSLLRSGIGAVTGKVLPSVASKVSPVVRGGLAYGAAGNATGRAIDYAQQAFSAAPFEAMMQEFAPEFERMGVNTAEIETMDDMKQVVRELGDQFVAGKQMKDMFNTQLIPELEKFAPQMGIPPETIAQIKSGAGSPDPEANKAAMEQFTGLLSEFGEKASQMGFLGDPKLGFLTKIAGIFGLAPGNAIYDWLAPMNNMQQGLLLGGLGSMLIGLIGAAAGSRTGAVLGIGGGLLAGGLGLYGRQIPGVQDYMGGPPEQQQPIQPEPTQSMVQPEIPGAPPPVTELERSTGEFTR